MKHVRKTTLLACVIVGLVTVHDVGGTNEAMTRAKTQIFTYEGEPNTVEVSDKTIVVDYQASRCEFDRASGRMRGRKTRAEGYKPMSTAEKYAKEQHRFADPLSIFPDHLQRGPAEANSIEFNGHTLRAVHRLDVESSQAMNDIKKAREKFGTWTAFLNALNAGSFVESTDAHNDRRVYTTANGLASNIVSRFAVANGTLWASCVDIFDPGRNEWGPGGLCRYNPQKDRWEKIEEIDGRPVRWVTMLQSAGDELWVGFREGDGVSGDRISYGMGIYPGIYQPVVKALVLARLKDGRWTSFARPPIDDPDPPYVRPTNDNPARTERLKQIIVRKQLVLVLSDSRAYNPANGERLFVGKLSCLDLNNGRWRMFDSRSELNADDAKNLIEKDGEAIATTNAGACLWRPDKRAWQFLDPQSPLKNPNIGALESVGNEVWVGYQRQWMISVEQGISRFNERTGVWDWMSPETIGTAAPVMSIVALPDGSVWVLFRERTIMAQMMEPRLYPPKHALPEHTGIGRYAENRWDFPVALDGVTTTTSYTAKLRGGGTRTFTQELPIGQMVGAGGKLFILNATGVYTGPNPWISFFKINPDESGPYRDDPTWPGMIIESAENGKAVLITDLGRQQMEYPDGNYPQALYRPGDSEVSFRPGKLADEVHQCIERGNTTRSELSLETPTARWTARYGELVREAK